MSVQPRGNDGLHLMPFPLGVREVLLKLVDRFLLPQTCERRSLLLVYLVGLKQQLLPELNQLCLSDLGAFVPHGRARIREAGLLYLLQEMTWMTNWQLDGVGRVASIRGAT